MYLFKVAIKNEATPEPRIVSPTKQHQKLDTIDEITPYRPGTPIPDKKKHKRYNST